MASNQNFDGKPRKRNDSYEVLFDVLPDIWSGQNDGARDNLLARGLTKEELTKLNYRVIPPIGTENRRRLDEKLKPMGLNQQQFYCFRKDGSFSSKIKGGVVIPQRNIWGDIVGLKLRDTESDADHKYIQLTRSPGGEPIHCPIIKRLMIHPQELNATFKGISVPENADTQFPNLKNVWITEGELKADIATMRGEMYVMGLPGLEPTNDAVPTVKAILDRFPEVDIVVALDNEETVETKASFGKIYRKLHSLTKVFFANWDGPKGLDEAVVANVNFVFTEGADDWRADLETNENGIPLKTARNLQMLFQNEKVFKDAIGFDEFTVSMMWRAQETLITTEPGPRSFMDADATALKVWMRENGWPEWSTEAIWETVQLWCVKNKFNSFQDWLGSVVWDKTPRLQSWLMKAYGASDTPLNAEIGKRFLIGVVNRGVNPGAKQDYMLILEGSQGIGKSYGLRLLCPREDWHSESFPKKLDDEKKVVEAMLGKLIVEVGELSLFVQNSFRWEDFKDLVTKQAFTYRPPYARLPLTIKRTSSMIGTTNTSQYLSSEEEQRRFLPVRVAQLNREWLLANRDQLFAEAAARLAAGENGLIEISVMEELKEQQSQRKSDDMAEFIDYFVRRFVNEKPNKIANWESVDFAATTTWAWEARTKPLMFSLPMEMAQAFFGCDATDSRLQANNKVMRAFAQSMAAIGYERKGFKTVRDGELRKWWQISPEAAESLKTIEAIEKQLIPTQA